MKKLTLLCVVLIGLVAPVDARIDHYDAKGFKVFTKECKTCHGNPYKGAAMKKQREWKKLFDNGAEKLLDIHKEIPEYTEVATLITRKSKVKHLRKFLMQSASDSGIVNSCDGNYCGR